MSSDYISQLETLVAFYGEEYREMIEGALIFADELAKTHTLDFNAFEYVAELMKKVKK